MAFALDPADPDIRAQVRRVAAGLIAATLADSRADTATRIHDMRKAVKKLRGLIRLVRPVMPDFASENAALRDAGRSIAPLREAEVMLATARSLTDGLHDDQRALIVAPFAAALDAALEPDALATQIARFRDAMAAIGDRAADWTIRGKGFGALSPGLTRTWADAQHALQRARANPAPETLHDWRKRVKDHWYQARLLAPIWPAMMDPHIAVVDDLGETLGLLNDLAEFAPHAAALPISPSLHEILDARMADRRASLLANAFGVGRPFLSEQGDAMSARWHGWWRLAGA